jgi:hypothetical protein
MCMVAVFGTTQNCRVAGSPNRPAPIEDLDDAENLMIKRAALILTLWCGSITEMALEKLDDRKWGFASDELD